MVHNTHTTTQTFEVSFRCESFTGGTERPRDVITAEGTSWEDAMMGFFDLARTSRTTPSGIVRPMMERYVEFGDTQKYNVKLEQADGSGGGHIRLETARKVLKDRLLFDIKVNPAACATI